MSDFVLRLQPYYYIHIHDTTNNVTSLEVGPKTMTIAQHQQLQTTEPQRFITVPPQHYCLIENPVVRDPATKELVRDKRGQVKNQVGEREVRFHQPPFPLYPNEKLVEQQPMQVLNALQALVLRANRAFTIEEPGAEGGKPVKVSRVAGEEWLFRGPAVYKPSIACDVVEQRQALNLAAGEALRLKAKVAFVDANGVQRQATEEYLWTQAGAYMVDVCETLVTVVKPVVLTPQKAIHVECIESFKDPRPWAKEADRRPGQVYLVTDDQTASFLPLTTERVVKEVSLLTVTRQQYAVILDPVEGGRQLLGRRKVITDTSIFLQPGERLEGNGAQAIYSLGADEALLLCADEDFTEPATGAKRKAGELWLLQGPSSYIPHSSVRIMKDKKGQEKRRRIVLADGEGVYVRNTQSGEVRAVIGGSYMLSATEELWEKELPPIVEDKIAHQSTCFTAYMDKDDSKVAARDKTRVVKFLVPNNAAAQVYDYKKRTQRTVIGPNAVLLGPDEQFTILNLSGSEWDKTRPTVCLPKKTNMIKSLYLFLGPSTMSDVIPVETSDHARLSLQMSYDWYFDAKTTEEIDQCFSVPDFVGDCCSCIASRVRASVASVEFDKFHKHSSEILRRAVFGVDQATDQPKKLLKFKANRLVVTSVDIQSLEVMDERTKIALQQSVKMAIEITTQAQEQSARQEATVREQQARGRLERQTIEDKAANEIERKTLLEAETASASIASTGHAKAEAQARSQAASLEGNANVTVARTRAEAAKVKEAMAVNLEKAKRDAELTHTSSLDKLEVETEKGMSVIESSKFQRTMDAVGKETVVALARAGPEAQAKLLKSLGIEGMLITDGQSPINLFQTAAGMVGAPAAKRQ
jgi:major vault protein